MKLIKKLLGTEKKKEIKKPTPKKEASKTESCICPYCKKTLKKKPSRKKKCEHCSELIYVRTMPSNRKQVVVTKKEAEKIDKKWGKAISLSKWIKNLNYEGITEIQIEEKKNELSKKFGKEASYNDTIWALLNELLIKNSNNLGKLSSVYYTMALFRDEEGKDPYQMLYECHKFNLMHLQESDFYKNVIISTAREKSCEHCRKLENKRYSISEAIQLMPLPVKECKHNICSDHGFCRCMWLGSHDKILED